MALRNSPRSQTKIVFLTFLASFYGLQAQTPTLGSATFFGGAGDQAGNALAIAAGMIYVGGEGGGGHFVRYALPPGAPTASSVLTGAYFRGMTATAGTVYPVGGALPPVCGASDGVGDTEGKSIVALYNAASGAFVNCFSTNAFPYRGGESYGGVVTDGSYLYAMGTAETCGFGNNSFILGKHDLAGALIMRVFEPTLDSSGHPCSGDSHGYAVTLLNGNIYIAGGSNLTGEDGVFRPVLMRYSTALTRDWRRRPIDNSGGIFNGVAGVGSAIYAVGYVGVYPNYDYLIEKYDESGNRLWSKTSGGAGTDVLNAVVSVGGRLFAVEYTSSQGAGGTDAVLLEFDASTGNALSTTTYGGALDEVANALTTDGTDLYVVGTSNSFASAAGNAIGQSDIMLLRYTLAPAYSVCLLYDPTKAIKSGSTIPIKLQLCDGSGNNLSSPSITVHAVSITQVSTSISGPVEDSGNANPDNDFRFDPALGATGGYIFNLRTTGLTTGTYSLNFTVTGDASSHAAPFQVK